MKKVVNNLIKALFVASSVILLVACGNEDNESPIMTVEAEPISQTDSEQTVTEASGEETLTDESVKGVESSLVYLFSEEGKEKVSGSGFIAEITEDTIYICTNQHVIADADAWNVTFADGTKAEGRKAGCSKVFDVGVVEVEADQLNEEERQKLTAVNVDLESWLTVRDEENTQCPIRVYRVSEEGNTGECVEGTIVSVLADFEYGNGLRHTKMDITLESGDSGSAVFDENGNLFAIVIGSSHAEEGKPTRWAVPLASLLTSYQEITGREWVPLF